MKYDLENRTTKFARAVIDLVRKIPASTVNTILIRQIIRSATSIGANYREANHASSKRDFINKIHICRKESNETLYWLEMLQYSCPNNKLPYKDLIQESLELTLIFSKISRTSSASFKNSDLKIRN